MTPLYEIRANYDQDSIIVYQAYSHRIADAAISAGRFAAPFSFQRMTWIKPSFLWLMHRSHWGQKANQERTLAIRMHRAHWEETLALGTLTHPEPSIYKDASLWQNKFRTSPVHVQWDTERNLRGNPLNHFSIQVGISRQLIREYVDNWVIEIQDISIIIKKIRALIKSGKIQQAKRFVPIERPYHVAANIGVPLLIQS